MIISGQDRQQSFMFSSLDDLISPEHPVRLLEYLIGTIISKNKEQYMTRGISHTGRPAYSSETMLKIFLYGYINRIISSRRLEQETCRNIELIWLTGNLSPDHKTISNFRKNNSEIIKQFSKDLKILLKQMGLIGNSVIAHDGTKLKANASRDMLSKRGALERLEAVEEELTFYLKQMQEQDELESGEEESERSGAYHSEITRLKEEVSLLQSQLEEFKVKGKNYISRTDPDCNMQKSREGNLPGYNVQISSDTEHKFIVYESAVTEANDKLQLKPALETIEEELSLKINEVVADTGFCNLDVIEQIEEDMEIECFVPHPKEQNKSPKIKFTYNEEQDYYTCSQGQILSLKHRHKKAKNSYVNVYIGENCGSCPLMKECTTSKKGRHISRFWNHNYRDKHKAKMQKDHAREMLRLRKSSIEHIMGTMKVWLGKIPLLTRGLEKVNVEIKLFSSSYNIKRLLSIFTFDEVKSMIKAITKTYEVKILINLFLNAKNNYYNLKYRIYFAYKRFFQLNACFGHFLQM